MSTQYQKIALHGVPRSGTSWLGEIFNSSPNTLYRYQPLFSYALKDRLNENSSAEQIQHLFDDLIHTEDEFINQSKNRDEKVLPKFEKSNLTHLVYKEVRYMNVLTNLLNKDPSVKLCALIRNPLSVMASWLQAPREFRHDLGWSPLEQWQDAELKNQGRAEEYFGYTKWKESAHLFLELRTLFPDRVYIQSYQSLLENTEQATRRLFNYFEIPYTRSTIEFIHQSSSMTNDSEYSVFRHSQSDDKWITQLDPIIISSIFADLEGSELSVYLPPKPN